MNNNKPMWQRPKHEKKIVLCETCRGTGLIRIHTDDPRFEGPYINDCFACNGRGRVLRSVITEHFILTDDFMNKNTF